MEPMESGAASAGYEFVKSFIKSRVGVGAYMPPLVVPLQLPLFLLLEVVV